MSGLTAGSFSGLKNLGVRKGAGLYPRRKDKHSFANDLLAILFSLRVQNSMEGEGCTRGTGGLRLFGKAQGEEMGGSESRGSKRGSVKSEIGSIVMNKRFIPIPGHFDYGDEVSVDGAERSAEKAFLEMPVEHPDDLTGGHADARFREDEFRVDDVGRIIFNEFRDESLEGLKVEGLRNSGVKVSRPTVNSTIPVSDRVGSGIRISPGMKGFETVVKLSPDSGPSVSRIPSERHRLNRKITGENGVGGTRDRSHRTGEPDPLNIEFVRPERNSVPKNIHRLHDVPLEKVNHTKNNRQARKEAASVKNVELIGGPSFKHVGENMGVSRKRSPHGVSRAVLSQVTEGIIDEVNAVYASGREFGQVRLRLFPPELGELRIRVELKGKKVKAFFLVENQKVKAIIDGGANRLAEAFTQEGYTLENFSVSVGEHRSNHDMEGDYEDVGFVGRPTRADDRVNGVRPGNGRKEGIDILV